MSLHAFYTAVLPAQGHYALFDGTRKRHIWCDSLDDLTRQTEARIDRQGLYFATAAFATDTDRTIDNALSRRAFCLDIDAGPDKVAKHGLDKVYASQGEALTSLVAWCRQVSLTPRCVVSSGAGLHVYFTLDVSIPVAQWQPVARAFKALASQSLKIDPGPTVDAVRILRPIGTLHSSGARVKLLGESSKDYTLDELRSRLGVVDAPVRASRLNADVLETPIGPPSSVAKIVERCGALRAVAAVRGDVEEPYWRAMLGLVKHTVEGREACHTFSQGHPEYDYADTERKIDRWTAGPATCDTFADCAPDACAACEHRGKIKSPIRLGWMCDDEARAAGVPTAVEVSEQRDIERAAARAEQAEGSPFGGDEVDDTPSVREPWSGQLPPALWPRNHYFIRRTATGGVVLGVNQPVEHVDGDGKKTSVVKDCAFANTGFWFESWAPGTSDADAAQVVYCVHDCTRDTVTRYTIPTKVFATRQDIFTALAAQNVQVYPPTKAARDAMEDYVRASLEAIRSAGQRPKIVTRFGTMHSPDGHVCVAQGRHLINRDGTITEGVVASALRSRGNAYTMNLDNPVCGAWGAQVWPELLVPRARRHVAYLREFYGMDNFRQFQLMIALAWGSPMLAFMEGLYAPGAELPGAGLTVTLYSPRSGIGKTAAMRAAALAFGVPTDIVLGGDASNMTDNARQELVLQAGTMPSFLDEMEDLEPRTIAGFINAVGNGQTKSRLRRDLSVIGGVPTALVSVMSTNKSHREIVAAARAESPAAQMRLLELDCSSVALVDPETRTREGQARSQLQDCAGAVGAVIHYAMARLGNAKLNQLGLRYADKACKAVGGRQDGRFMWRALGAALAVRAILASVDADLVAFSDDDLIAEFKHWHDSCYRFTIEEMLPSDGPSLATMILTELAPYTLITDHAMREGGVVPYRNDRIPNEVHARTVLSEDHCYVKIQAVDAWAAERKYGKRALREILMASRVWDGQIVRRDLFHGTRAAQGVRCSVMRFDLRRIQDAFESPDARDRTARVVQMQPRSAA